MLKGMGALEKRKKIMDASRVDWSDTKIQWVEPYCRGKKVLDLGCVQHDPLASNNEDWLHRAIAVRADSVVGLDIDADGVDVLTQDGWNIIVGDAQAFSFDSKFDVIVAGDLIEHLSNFGMFLDCCAENITDEGKILIATPNPTHWFHILFSTYKAPPINPEHTCWLCPTTLAQLAARSGLVVTDVKYGSNRLKKKIMPLPMRLRHASFFAVLEKQGA